MNQAEPIQVSAEALSLTANDDALPCEQMSWDLMPWRATFSYVAKRR